MKYLILVLLVLFHSTVSAKVTPRPTATPRPEVSYNWAQGNNPKLLMEGGNYTMAWWPWFQPKNRPSAGKAFLLLNHSNDKDDPFGYGEGAAFSPNGQEISDLVEFYNSKGKLISFCVYRGVVIVAPGRGSPVIIVAQNFVPNLDGGIPYAGVRIFMNEIHFQNWISKTVR